MNRTEQILKIALKSDNLYRSHLARYLWRETEKAHYSGNLEIYDAKFQKAKIT